MGYSLCVLLSYSAFFAWFVTGPVLLIKIVGISPVTFGWITMFGVGCATMLASYLNGKLVSRTGMHFMLRVGWSIMIIAGVLMLAGKYLIGINATVIVIPVILFFFGAAFIWPNAFADAFIPFGKIAGYAGALYGSMQIVGGAAISGLVAHIPTYNQIPLALIFIIPSILAWMSFKWIVKP